MQTLTRHISDSFNVRANSLKNLNWTFSWLREINNLFRVTSTKVFYVLPINNKMDTVKLKPYLSHTKVQLCKKEKTVFKVWILNAFFFPTCRELRSRLRFPEVGFCFHLCYNFVYQKQQQKSLFCAQACSPNSVSCVVSNTIQALLACSCISLGTILL